MRQMIRAMCSRDVYGFSRLGEIEDVRGITPQSAWAHYQKILQESPVELFYVGQKPAGEVAQLLQPLCDVLAKEAKPMADQTDFRDGGKVDLTENAEMVQARLCLGYTTPVTIRKERFAAMQVLNALLGGGMTSKLFMNVREKLSLCYDISSSFRSSKGLLILTAGVDPEKLEVAKTEILRQVQACKDGDFSEQELVAAKQGLVTALQGVHDSPGGIEDYYVTILLSQAQWTPVEYLAAVEKVTAQQVIEAAQALTLHTQYVLKGEK
jgi:predicted Zn-dependent peptidase